MSTPQSSSYFPHIDGLRAISILAVVFYHIGFDPFNSGYMGVDIFFVISGFLIINHLTNSLREGSFSFRDFWARRALRILPPYFLVIVTCLLISPFFLYSYEEQAAFAEQVFYASIMLANHLFLSQQGYFDTDANSKVLLHLWSLGVEEQFYIVAPILLFLVFKFMRKASLPIGVALFLASFVLCILLTHPAGGTNYSFFLMPLRAWEFMAGAAVVLAVPFAKKLPSKTLGRIGWTGLIIVLISITSFSSQSLFPGYLAALPVIGACLLILTGLVSPQAKAIRFLSSKPMAYIGLISYAWYLWHWPLLVLARNYNFGSLSDRWEYSIFAISFLLAVATRHWVEKPILKIRNQYPHILNGKTILVSIAFCICIGVIGIFSNNANNPNTLALNISYPSSAHVAHCHISERMASAENCLSHPPISTKPSGLLLGDSHASSSSRALFHFADEQSSRLFFAAGGGCIGVLGLNVKMNDQNMYRRCVTGREKLHELWGAGFKPEYAIIVSRWDLYLNKEGKDFRLTSSDGEVAKDNLNDLFLSQFANMVAQFKQQGVQRILVVAPLPSFPHRVPVCIARADHMNKDRVQDCAISRSRIENLRRNAVRLLSEAANQHASVRLIDPIDLFCDAITCRPFHENELYFVDTNHPSDTGVELIISNFKDDFDWVVTGTP